jgi:hypothetical protein
MKAISKAIFIIICLTFSCNTDDSLSAPELKRKVDELKTQITGIMDVSTGETSDDCRTRYIQGGDGCGPIYVYGVVGIDTLELENLFAELSNTQTELYKLEGGPVCRIAFPAKDSLINETCKACFGTEGNYECY